MVALDKYFHHKGTKTRSWRFATSISPVFRNRPLVIDHCSLIFERSADAYGNTLIFTAPDTTGNWWGDGVVQSDYGANEIIYCGYRYDPETQLYYVRNRTYSPFLGRWIQRDPIGYAGGINLYEYVGGKVVVTLDAMGQESRSTCMTKCLIGFILCTFGTTPESGGTGFFACLGALLLCNSDCPPPPKSPPQPNPSPSCPPKHWPPFIPT